MQDAGLAEPDPPPLLENVFDGRGRVDRGEQDELAPTRRLRASVGDRRARPVRVVGEELCLLQQRMLRLLIQIWSPHLLVQLGWLLSKLGLLLGVESSVPADARGADLHLFGGLLDAGNREELLKYDGEEEVDHKEAADDDDQKVVDDHIRRVRVFERKHRRRPVVEGDRLQQHDEGDRHAIVRHEAIRGVEVEVRARVVRLALVGAPRITGGLRVVLQLLVRREERQVHVGRRTTIVQDALEELDADDAED